MRILILTFIFSVLFGKHIFAQNDADGTIEEAVELFKSGERNKAENILVKRIKADKNDTDSRLMLGMFANYIGNKAEAVSIWEAGLNGENIDYPLLMSIGDVYLDELSSIRLGGEDTENYMGITYGHEHDTLCRKAIRIFARAHSFHPYEPEPIEKLAILYAYRENYDSAFYFRNILSEMYPEEARYVTGKGNLMMQKKEYLSALRLFRDAILLDKTFAQAYLGLSECFRAMNKDLEADVYAKKAEFYMLCPNFLDINYSTRFSDVLDSLFLISSSQKINFNTEIFLTDCGADAPETAAFLLSCRIFSGSDAEFELTQYLSEQGNKGIWYLMKLVEASEDPVFIDNAVKSITKKNIPGIFDFLDGLIKKDIVNYGHSVISAFRTMEDFRIEATLMREIKNTKPSKSFRKEPSPAFQMVLLNESIHNIRIEATLALSDFNTPSSVEFLKTGLEDEQIAPYCGAALYKLTGDEKYLNSIEKSIKEDEKDVVLADFLRRFNNLKAQKLAKKLTLF